MRGSAHFLRARRQKHGDSQRTIDLQICHRKTKRSVQRCRQNRGQTDASGMQVKLVLDSMVNGYNKLYAENGQELHFSVEDRGAKWAFVSVECPLCAGKVADA